MSDFPEDKDPDALNFKKVHKQADHDYHRYAENISPIKARVLLKCYTGPHGHPRRHAFGDPPPPEWSKFIDGQVDIVPAKTARKTKPRQSPGRKSRK